MSKTNNLIKQISKNISVTPRAKQYLNIDVKYQHDSNNGNRKATVELKIGENKLYVVRNIREFFTCYNSGFESMEFGKNFTYNPYLHSFKKKI